MNDLGLLAVHAHPDDEAIATGGILARYAAEGIRVGLVCATLGEVGEIVDPTIDQSQARPRLGEIRKNELRAACAVLGVRDIFFLGYRDSGMAGTFDNQNPQAFCQADLFEATARLVRIVREQQPHVVVTYNEHGGYGHPDHIMAHRISVAAFEEAGDVRRFPEMGLPVWQPSKLYFSAFPRSWLDRVLTRLREAGQPSPFDRPDLSPERIATPDHEITTKVDVRPFLEQKRDAIRSHRTQIGPDNIFFRLPDDLAREGLGFEHFVRARNRVISAPLREDDLFAGLR